MECKREKVFTVAHLLQLWPQLQLTGIRPSACTLKHIQSTAPQARETPEQSLPEQRVQEHLACLDLMFPGHTIQPVQKLGFLGFKLVW